MLPYFGGELTSMRYYIIAGEASGDLHGGNLIRELIKLDPSAAIRCWGGENMEHAGGKLAMHYRNLAFMGFWEVISNLPAILRNFSFCKKDITEFAPDVLICIDYPGFNLRMIKWAKMRGIKTVYYISPQVWAWKEGRVKDIKKHVDKMLVILPFEKAFYDKWEFPVDYVGHPLVQVIDDYKKQNLPSDRIKSGEKPIIALLPGSRKQEIRAKLPIMLTAANAFPQYQFIVAKAPSIEDAFYENMMKDYGQVQCLTGQTYSLLSYAKAALVTSGTATLETALFGIPQVICYKGNPVSYQIAKRLVKIKFIGLVNLIMNKEVVKELIQDKLSTENLVRELEAIAAETDRRRQILQDYALLHDLLSKDGNASMKAARIISDFLKSAKQ
jgi:lipid-A-disaccharide synthase